MNAIHSKQYLAWHERCQAVFCSDYRKDYDKLSLSDRWHLNIRYYEGQVTGLNLRASECELLDEKGRVYYSWRNIDNDAEFYKIIRHSNGGEYLIFRQDLYGYSVLDLQTFRELHYIPHHAYPENQEDFEETFIWTDVNYNPHSNELAVTGCYWACPMSVILLDFSQPLIAVEDWIDVHRLIDDSYDIYDDIIFKGWGDDSAIILEADRAEPPYKEIIVLNREMLFPMSMINSMNNKEATNDRVY